MIDDLIHLILRLQIATRTQVPGLPTRLAPLALPAHQLLGLRASLRPPLRPRLGRIRRRRLRTRARILPRLLLQPPQPTVVQLNPARQLEDELDTRLAPRVIIASASLATQLNKELGLSPQKTSRALAQFGIRVTPGGVVQAIARQARWLEPTYQALALAVRNSSAVAPDETGWRVAARKR